MFRIPRQNAGIGAEIEIGSGIAIEKVARTFGGSNGNGEQAVANVVAEPLGRGATKAKEPR